VSRDLDLDLLDVEIGPRDPAFGTPLRWSDLAIAAVALAGAAAAVAVVATGGVAADPSTFAAVLVANVLALAGGGLVWRYGRPTSAFGYLLLGEAVLVLVSSLAGSSSPVSYLIGILALWATALGATWLLLAFPGACPRGNAAWFVLGSAAATFFL